MRVSEQNNSVVSTAAESRLPPSSDNTGTAGAKNTQETEKKEESENIKN